MEKQKRKMTAEQDEALLSKSSLAIELVPENEDDKRLASLLKYNAVECEPSLLSLRWPPQSTSTGFRLLPSVSQQVLKGHLRKVLQQ